MRQNNRGVEDLGVVCGLPRGLVRNKSSPLWTHSSAHTVHSAVQKSGQDINQGKIQLSARVG